MNMLASSHCWVVDTGHYLVTCTTFGLDLFTTKLLVLTFVLHNIRFRPFYHTTFWSFYYTTFDFDLFTTQHWGLTVFYTTLGFDLCTTQHSILTFLTPHSILTFLLNNIWFWPFYYTTFDFDLLTTQLLVSTVLLHQTRFWPVAGTTVCEVHVLEVECTKNQNSVGTTTTWYQRVYQETSVWWDSVPQNQILRYGVRKYPTSKIESKVT